MVATSREVATRTRDEIEQLVAAHDVVRGQVIAFGVSEYRGNELVTFLPRPTITEQQVVLPDGVLAGIEEHILGVAEHAERLLAAGQHLKRGLLLYGPPGTGKTHTVRYLAGRLPDTTVVVLTGAAMRYINQAAAQTVDDNQVITTATEQRIPTNAYDMSTGVKAVTAERPKSSSTAMAASFFSLRSSAMNFA